MLRQYLSLFFLVWVLNSVIVCKSEIAETEKNKIDVKNPNMAPNSKFLNPNFDEATNLKFAVAAFVDDRWKDENIKKGEMTEGSSTVSETLTTVMPKDEGSKSRTSKYLKDLSIISLFRSKINDKFKKF